MLFLRFINHFKLKAKDVYGHNHRALQDQIR